VLKTEKMKINDYDSIIKLWKTDKNIGLSRADEKKKLRASPL
jgi:hypothetical protein